MEERNSRKLLEASKEASMPWRAPLRKSNGRIKTRTSQPDPGQRSRRPTPEGGIQRATKVPDIELDSQFLASCDKTQFFMSFLTTLDVLTKTHLLGAGS